jgi:hypothetical protein
MHDKTMLMGATLLALASAGCFSTWDLAPKSLASLDGYHEPQKVPLADVRGEEVVFDKSTELRFFQGDGEPRAKGKFSAIEVRGSQFTGAVRPDGHPLVVDLGQLSAVTAKKYSPVKTGLAIGIPVGVVFVATVVLVAVAVASISSGAGALGAASGPLQGPATPR